MTHATILAKPDEGEAPRLSPLEAFVQWVANLIATITGMKRRKTFPTNWKDHWEGLRQLEWCWDQMLAACAAEVLAGGSLDRDIGFELVMDVPADYGRPCPSTPQDMNRRFILIQRLRLDPDKYILRHIRRIAKREGIKLETSSSGCPLRHAPPATSPALRAEEESACARRNHRSLSSLGEAGGGGARVLHARDGATVLFQAKLR